MGVWKPKEWLLPRDRLVESVMRQLAVRKCRIRPFGQHVLMGVPKIHVRFVVLRVFLLFLLDLGDTLLFLISAGLGGFRRRFATDHNGRRRNYPNELKHFHAPNIQQVGFRGNDLLKRLTDETACLHTRLTGLHLGGCCHRIQR
jgi:hypothetical protein